MATTGNSPNTSCSNISLQRSQTEHCHGLDYSRRRRLNMSSSRSLLGDTLPGRCSNCEVNDGDSFQERSVVKSVSGDADGEVRSRELLVASSGSMQRSQILENTVKPEHVDGEETKNTEEELKDNEDVMRDEGHICPIDIYCSLIPSCAIDQCKI